MVFLADLKIIDLSENQIQELPAEIGDLAHLEQLFCRQNKLKKFPKLTKCCKLKVKILALLTFIENYIIKTILILKKDWDLSFNCKPRLHYCHSCLKCLIFVLFFVSYK